MAGVRAPGKITARSAAWPLALLALPFAVFGASAAPVPSGPRTLTATISAPAISYGDPIAISGRLTASGQALPGAQLQLQANSYPFRGYVTIATGTSKPDGTYSFTGVRPNRNTELRVVAVGGETGQSPGDQLVVNPVTHLSARDLGPGVVSLNLDVRHTAYEAGDPSRAYWYLAAQGSSAFRLQAVSQTTESPRLTSASVTVNPPSAAFTYRVCFVPAWRHAMGTSATYRRCVSANGLAAQATGSGTPAPVFPSSQAVAAAGRFLDGRTGSTAFAVVDDTGAVSGVRVHQHFETASVVKVMMLVSYLQELAAKHQGIDAASNAILYPMIHISDNDAASAVFAHIGGYPALEKIATQTGMTDFVPGVGWWAYTQTSAADQARFFYELDGLIPAQFDGYARDLLSGIEAEQSWGVPPVARPEWDIYFKTGALPSVGLFNEGALLQRGRVRFALCVLTTGDPSMAYGEESIQGVGSALLAG